MGMAATALLRSSVAFNSPGNAGHVPIPAPSLLGSRLPPARELRAGGGQRLDPSGGLNRSARHRRRSVRAGAPCQRAIPPRDDAACAGDGPTRRPAAPRFLCLHGFRTSGEIMRRQVVGKWPAEVTSRLDLAFPDAPFPAEGESPVHGVFDPPYYEWCQFVGEDFLKYSNFGECLEKVEELMIREGPFDGLLGFSQGGLLSAALAGLQEQGLALNRIPKVKYVMVISGGKIQHPTMAAKAYDNKIKCPSLHIIGDNDFVRTHGEELADSFVDPLVVRHPCGHTVPRLDEKGLRVMLSYLDRIEDDAENKSDWGSGLELGSIAF